MGAIWITVLKAHTISDVEMVEAKENGQVVERPNRPYQPRAQRWSGVKQTKQEAIKSHQHIEEL